MIYGKKGYNRLLVGDLYHWELDSRGNVFVKGNMPAGKQGK